MPRKVKVVKETRCSSCADNETLEDFRHRAAEVSACLEDEKLRYQRLLLDRYKIDRLHEQLCANLMSVQDDARRDFDGIVEKTNVISDRADRLADELANLELRTKEKKALVDREVERERALALQLEEMRRENDKKHAEYRETKKRFEEKRARVDVLTKRCVQV